MRVSLLNNHTTIHEDHLVCNITSKSHLMCDNNHCGILLRHFEQYQDEINTLYESHFQKPV